MFQPNSVLIFELSPNMISSSIALNLSGEFSLTSISLLEKLRTISKISLI